MLKIIPKENLVNVVKIRLLMLVKRVKDKDYQMLLTKYKIKLMNLKV